MSQKNPLGLVCLYKNGKSQHFTGKEEVNAAVKDGWKDSPVTKKEFKSKD